MYNIPSYQRKCDDDEDQTLSSEQHQKHVIFLFCSISPMACYQASSSLLKSEFFMVGLPTEDSNTKYMHSQKIWNIFYHVW